MEPRNIPGMNNVYWLICLFLVSCGSRALKQNGPAPIEKAKTKTTAVAKPIPSTQPQTYPSQHYLQDDAALPYIQKSPACLAMVDRNSCPSGTRRNFDIAVGPNDELLDCLIRCVKKGGVYHGPFERIVVSGFGAGEYERGTYEDNLTVGRWVRGKNVCSSPKLCKDQMHSESFYLKKYGIDGLQRSWNDKGQLIRAQSFKKGVPEGKFEEWWDNGLPRRRSDYKNGVLHGDYKLWHSNGQTNIHATYVSGGVQGPWIEYDEKGNRIVEGTYKSGIRVGQWNRWFANSQPQSEENYDSRGKPSGTFCYWKSDGSLIRCFEIKDGMGTFYHFDQVGVLLREYTLRGGAIHGKETVYNYEGRIIGETFYDNNQLHGTATNWDDKGRLTSVHSYHRGQLHGLYVQQYWTGDLVGSMSRGQYCLDRQCGTWRHEMEDGRIRDEGFSDQGTLLYERTLGPTGELEFEWPSANSLDPYEKCLYAMRNGGCCVAIQNPPVGATICPRSTRD